MTIFYVTRLQGKNELFCFANDTLVLLVANRLDTLNEYVATDLRRILRAIGDLGLKVSEPKTNIMLFGGNNRDLPRLKIGGSYIEAKRCMKYLGVILDNKWSFNNHFAYIKDKADKVTRSLEKLMPNLKGPGQSKRRLYLEVVLSILLYASPLWYESLKKAKKKSLALNKLLRRLGLRLICGYKTTSKDAALLLAAIPPIHLLAETRGNTFLRIRQTIRDGSFSKELVTIIKNEEFNYLHNKWRRYVQNHSSFGRHTIEAVLPSFEKWTKRRFGYLNYHLTQFLTVHGCFGSFLCKIGKRYDPKCWHCDSGENDTPAHTLFYCQNWIEERRVLMNSLGEVSSMAEMVKAMLTSQEKWSAACIFADLVLTAKERAAERSELSLNHPGLQDWDSDCE